MAGMAARDAMRKWTPTFFIIGRLDFYIG